MADLTDPNIPRKDSADIILPEMKCYTKVRNIKCTYTWIIQDFKSVCGKEAVLKSTPFSTSNDTCTWLLEAHLKKNSSYNEKYLGVYLKAYNVNEIVKYGPMFGSLTFSLINFKGQKTNAIAVNFMMDETKTHCGSDYFMEECNLLNDGSLLPQNTLTIKCEITFIKHENTPGIVFPGNYCFVGFESDKSEFLEEFEELFLKEDYSDMKICINDKEYPAHRTILAARSPVFAAMLKHNTKENHQSCIEIKDIDEQVFLETLRYIYSGKVHDLEILAFELLPIADKYSIKRLKMICEQMLFRKMSAETVIKILVLADMHNVDTLKISAIDYIRANSINVTNLMGTEGWNDLTSRPYLMKDILSAYMK